MSECIFPPTGTTMQFIDPWSLPYDIVCNGFSLKETILDVLYTSSAAFGVNPPEALVLAEEIKEALAFKLRLKQGYI